MDKLHKYSLFNMLVNVDINFKDCFLAYILRWTPPHGEIGNCQQTSPDCYAKTFDFKTSLLYSKFLSSITFVANKIREYNLLAIKQFVYVMEKSR